MRPREAGKKKAEADRSGSGVKFLYRFTGTSQVEPPGYVYQLSRQDSRSQEEQQFACDVELTVVCLNRLPNTGTLPTNRNLFDVVFCCVTIMPPITTVDRR